MPVASVWRLKQAMRLREFDPHNADNEPCTHPYDGLRACIDCGGVSCFDCGSSIASGPSLSTITEWICGPCQRSDEQDVDLYVLEPDHDEDVEDDELDERELDALIYDSEMGTINEPACKHCGEAYTDCGCEEFEAKL